MRLYLPPIRTGTFGTYDGGRDMNQIKKTVGLYKSGWADSGLRKVREMTAYHPEDAGEALEKPKGFGRRNVGARIPQIELLCFSCFVNSSLENRLYETHNRNLHLSGNLESDNPGANSADTLYLPV